MKCGKCGKVYDDDQEIESKQKIDPNNPLTFRRRFCKKCGWRLDDKPYIQLELPFQAI